MKDRPKGVLVLEDGREFTGVLFGKIFSIKDFKSKPRDKGFGEVCFNTSMTGYQEILTDPSYYGQIICMTTPHIGNTGINSQDIESRKPWCAGFVVHQNSSIHSNWRAEGDLENYLKENDIPGIQDVDTRALTRHLRSKGATRGIILPLEEKSQAISLLKTLPGFEGRDLIREVSTPQPYSWSKSKGSHYRVTAIDFGVKSNLLRCLEKRGCDVEVLPASSSAEEILSTQPDGVFLSNGPGDPSMAPYAVQTVKNLLGKVPIFGVCMGHQILCLALGGKTYKLKFGHRGGNQPVFFSPNQKVEISSHNHGYAVDANSLPKNVEITHVNLNDKTVEGIRAPKSRAFSVQYHPEASPGPHDSMELFDQFIQLMEQ